MLMKTKAVSDQLDVNPTTIQRWVKNFNVPCEKNEHGHLLFRNEDIDELTHIKTQLKKGFSMAEVKLLDKGDHPRNKGIRMDDYEKRLDEMLERMKRMEEKISEKADEVVSVQLFQHRSEIDELMKTMTNIEERMKMIERQMPNVTPPTKPEEGRGEEMKPKRNWLVSLFGT